MTVRSSHQSHTTRGPGHGAESLTDTLLDNTSLVCWLAAWLDSGPSNLVQEGPALLGPGKIATTLPNPPLRSGPRKLALSMSAHAGPTRHGQGGA